MKITDLKNRHKNKPCFVIGNGPSLTEKQIKLAKEHISIGTNGIVFNEWDFEPDYFAINDRGILLDEEFWKRIQKLKCEIVMTEWPLLSANRIGLEFPPHIQEFFNRVTIVPSINKPTGYPPRVSKPEDISFDLEKGVFTCGTTVLDLSIPLAVYLGCDPIYIIGCDCTNNGHFYEYRTDPDDNGPTDRTVRLQYRIFAKRLEEDNIYVYNLTPTKLSCPGIKRYEY